jgi:ATP-dependent RNA helicase DeaD
MTTFQELGLSKTTVSAIAEMGFENPTPIQEQAIPHMLTGTTDVVALAQTGTGKTAAFGLPLLELLDFQNKKTQAFILAPTRELCVQIAKDIQRFSAHTTGANVVPVYGGASIETQIREIKRGAQILVGTPGRTLDLIERGVIDLSAVDFVILDEADEMLHMGFKEDLDAILSETPEEKQTWLFSATMPAEVSRIAKNYMTNPVEITVGNKNSGNENIEHVYYVTHQRDKYLALKRLADFNPDIFAIVFCRTKAETQSVSEALIKDGYNADSIHGDLSQAQRDNVMKRYRNRTLQMLVATDVAARGIDVNDVTHVIQYNLPDEIENYTHRSGRTARAGKKGISIVLINMKENFRIKQLEKIIQTTFTKGTLPTPADVCEKQLLHLVNRVKETEVNQGSIGKYLPAVYEEFADFTKEQVIQHFVSTEFNRFLEYYKNAPDLNVDASRGDARGATPGVVKMYINVGKKDQFTFNTLKTYIAEATGVSEQEIPWSDLKDTFSLFEVRTASYDKVLEVFNSGVKYRGRTIRVESRGNQEAGIGRVRHRGNKSYSGGYENRGGGERSSGGGDRNSGGGYNRDRGPRTGGSDRSASERSSGGGERRSSGGDRSSTGSSAGSSSGRAGGWKFKEGGAKKKKY